MKPSSSASSFYMTPLPWSLFSWKVLLNWLPEEEEDKACSLFAVFNTTAAVCLLSVSSQLCLHHSFSDFTTWYLFYLIHQVVTLFMNSLRNVSLIKQYPGGIVTGYQECTKHLTPSLELQHFILCTASLPRVGLWAGPQGFWPWNLSDLLMCLYSVTCLALWDIRHAL